MYEEDVNIFELRSLFDTYYSSHDFVKTRHTQYFKRLMKHYSTNVDVNGFIVSDQQSGFVSTQKSPTSPWQEAGPWEYDHEQAMEFSVQSPGSAHVYTVEQSPINPSLVYAGTATAGLWKSIDKGLNWTLVTHDLDVNDVYAIALDPADQNIVYFGERNGKIWKSIDAGTTWNLTGDAAFQAQNSYVRDLKFIGANTILAATDDGLFRSTNAGANWTTVQSGEHMEIEIKPDNPNILYTVRLISNKTEFYKSTDNGLTWTIKTNGWPSPASSNDQRRCEISISAADPNLIHILASGQVGSDGGLYGIYKSTDAGESFTFECCEGAPGGTATVTNPNILGWSVDGTGEGGQFYYDLAMATSPTDVDRVFGAGINVWRSVTGGTSWSLNSHWVTWVQNGGLKHRYNHADVHDIKFFQNGGDVDMWIASDGGLFYSSNQGDSLEPRMHGIHGTDFWGFGAGFKEGYVMVGGTYHNGTLIRYNDIYKGGLNDPTQGGWLGELGGDNYRGFVNYADANIGYADNGAFNFSSVREERISQRAFDDNKNCNTSYVSGEYGTFGFNPNNYNTFYSPVGNELYKTENGGVSFELVNFFGGDKVIQVQVAWSNPEILYVTHKIGNDFYIKRSEDGGQTWAIRNPSSAVANGNQNRTKYFEVDDKDPNKIWCILMGNHSGNKVFQSTDGGVTWSNITTATIQNENLRSISHHYGTDDGIYIGTTKRVYYKNASMSDWALFNNNLPASTACNFLQPYYGEGKIRTASQRGVYECDFYEDAPPVAMISANQTELNLQSNCILDTIHFADHSTTRHASASWQWYFEGGVPTTSTLENPSIVYDTPGTYDVKLVVSDAFGADSVEYADFITITSSAANPNISEDFNGTEFPPAGWKLIDSEGSSWEKDSPQDDPTNGVAAFPNYWVDATGQQHLLVMPAVDLSQSTSYSMSFYYMYNNNGNYEDSLAVVYRTASNSAWQTLWVKGGDDLSNQGSSTWFWDAATPTLVWKLVTLDLSALLGESCVEIAFDNRGMDGNHIWVDNVNFNGSHASLSESTLNAFVSPNPSTGTFSIAMNEPITGYSVRSITGQEVMKGNTSDNTHFSLDLSEQATGVYFLQLTGNNGSKTIRLIKQ